MSQGVEAVGPADCARLAALDLASLTGEEAVAAMRLAFRVSNWAASMLDRTMYEACRAEEGTTVRRDLDRHSCLEAAAAFGWSTSMAARRLDLAADRLERLPSVATAMAEGGLEPRKAQVFSDVLVEMTPEHLRRTCEEVLPEAAGLPVGALGDRLTEVAMSLDSEWSARRLARALGEARVTHRRNDSGSGDLCGRDLPLEDAIRSRAHLDALAAAVHSGVREHGVRPPRRAWVRARVLCRLTDGSLTGLDDEESAARLVREIAAELGGGGRDDDGPSGPDDGPSGEPEPDDEPDGDGPDDGPDDGGPEDGGPEDKGPEDGGPDDGGPDDGGPDDDVSADLGPPPDGGTDPHGRPASGPVPPEPDPPEPAAPEPDLPEPPAHEPDLPEPESEETFPDVPGTRLRTGIVEVPLRLSTLLGHDDLPGFVPSWGTVGSATARTLALARPGGEWRVVLCDDDGRPTHVLVPRRRPTHVPRHRRDGRDGRAIVELAVRTRDLQALHLDDDDPYAPFVRAAQDALEGLPALDDPAHPAATRAHATRRRPGPELDRWLRVRDRCCIGPSCHQPAATAQIDHTRDWALGGATIADNTGVPCPTHHRAKTDGRWRLAQPRPGHFRWTSPAGIEYETRPRRVIDSLPDPMTTRTAPVPRPPLDDEPADGREAPSRAGPGEADSPEDSRSPGGGVRDLLRHWPSVMATDAPSTGPDPPF